MNRLVAIIAAHLIMLLSVACGGQAEPAGPPVAIATTTCLLYTSRCV